MDIVIIGGNLAGVTAARELKKLADRDSNLDLKITIFNEENEYFYPRPRLAEFFSEQITKDRLVPYGKEWYEENGITYLKDTRVIDIVPEKKYVRTDKGKDYNYDKLLITTGARPFIPPIEGQDLDNVFVYRSLADVHRIKGNLAGVDRVAVIGGGLLGIETAKAFNMHGKHVCIIERAPHLLARQLDNSQGKLFRNKLKKFDFDIYVNSLGYKFVGNNGKISGIAFHKGDNASKRIEVQMAVISTGVRPNVELATNTGVDIEVNRGIVVDPYMETSITDVFAAGDCVECPHTGIVWANVPVALEQARVASHNILYPKSRAYESQKPGLKLKLSEVTMQSIGQSNPQKDCHCHCYKDTVGQVCVYEKGDEVIGASFVGTTKGLSVLKKMVNEKKIVLNLHKVLRKSDINTLEDNLMELL